MASLWLTVVGLAVLVCGFVPWTQILYLAAQEQRDFQNAMAASLRAIRNGDAGAVLALCSATAAYGFVHALGPGHGKVLLGGAALASGATMRRMVGLTLISSLMQAISAIGLVAGGAMVLDWATRDLVGFTEAWLAPASALAITGIGVLLMVRGGRAWVRTMQNRDHGSGSDCGCGHSHGPTVSEVTSLASKRDALVLVTSIAMRPCTGALFVLVIALRMDIFLVGSLAVVAMGLGTAAFNLVIAGSGVTARRLAAFPLQGHAMRQFSAGVHVLAGTLIALISLGLIWASSISFF